MRLFTLILGALLLTLSATQVSASPEPSHENRTQTCRIVTGYGTAIGKGSTKKEARDAARLSCGTHLIDQYFASRRNIPEEVKDDLALACVNLDCT